MNFIIRCGIANRKVSSGFGETFPTCCRDVKTTKLGGYFEAHPNPADLETKRAYPGNEFTCEYVRVPGFFLSRGGK